MLILLAFWPVLLTIYLSNSVEEVVGQPASSAVQLQKGETKQKKPKQRKQAKKSPETAADSHTDSAKDSSNNLESHFSTGDVSGALAAGTASVVAVAEAPKPIVKKSSQAASGTDVTGAVGAGAASASAAAEVPKPIVKKSSQAHPAPTSAAASKQDDKSAMIALSVVKPCPANTQKRKAQGSFALVTRIYTNDLPYVGSFIRHYQNLGVTTFYFALTRKSDGKDVREYLLDLPFLESTAWQLFKNDRPEPKRFPVGVLGDMVKWVREDFIVQVDIDEYVTLTCNLNSFGELVASDPDVALFRFGWVTVVIDSHDSFIVQPPYRGVQWKGSKFLVRRNAVESVPSGDQKIKLDCVDESDCQVRTLPKTLVHFYTRGFGDGLVKAVGAFHANDQDSNSKKLRWLTRQGRVPPRLRMLAYMSVSSAKSGSLLLDSAQMPIVTIDRGQESRLLKHHNVSKEVISQALAVYAKYKANITQDEVWNEIKGEASLFGIAKAVRE